MLGFNFLATTACSFVPFAMKNKKLRIIALNFFSSNPPRTYSYSSAVLLWWAMEVLDLFIVLIWWTMEVLEERPWGSDVCIL